jgi:ABC-2 type transport system permease protein
MKFQPFIVRIGAIARKEALHILRDPRSLIMALAVPFFILLLFGYALTLDVDRVPTLVYDHDRTPQSRELIQRFAGSRYFHVLGSVEGYGPIDREIDKNRCLLAVVIPHDYARNLLTARASEVQLLFDGSDSNTASIALGYAQALTQLYAFEVRANWMNRRGGERLKPTVEPRLRVWYNSELESRNYIVPGLIAVILMIIASLLTSLTIAREWETGSMEQLLSTPLRPHELVLGKMAAYFVLGLIDTISTITLGVFVFGVPLRGNPLMVLFTASVFLIGALFWGIFLSATARTQLLAYQLGMITSFLPAFLLSGFVFAIENMPLVIQAISYVFPSRYFITILKGVFLKGIGLDVLWVETAFLFAYALIVFILATRKARQRLA